MQLCPRCGSGVADGRDTCQVCKADMKAPAVKPEDEREANLPQNAVPGTGADAPGFMQPAAPSGGSEYRTTLGGDVIEVNQSGGHGSGPAAGPQSPIGTRPGPPQRPGQASAAPQPLPVRQPMPGPAPAAPPRPAPAPPTRSGGPVMTTEVSSQGGSKTGVIALVVILLLVVLGGAGGAYYYMKKVQPAAPVKAFMDAALQQKWEVAYDYIELPAMVKSMVTKEMFAGFIKMATAKTSLKAYEIQGVTEEAGAFKVSVKVTATGPKGEETTTSDIPVKKFGDVYKIDASSMNPAAARGSLPGLGGM